MITLYKPENETEAIAVIALLEENSIHCSMQSFRDTAYDGVFQGQMGWGVINVNKVDFEIAEELLTKWKTGFPVSNQIDDISESSPSNEQTKRPRQKYFSMPLLLSISAVVNVLLIVLYFAPKLRQPTDYEVYDTTGDKLGLAEWKDNEIFPYKYITYLKNGKASSVSIDSKDSGRPEKFVMLQDSIKSTYKDEDGNGMYEYGKTVFDSGSKIEFWDNDQNGIYEKSIIRTTSGKTYNIQHSNKNGFDLVIKTPSGKELDFDILKQIANEM